MDHQIELTAVGDFGIVNLDLIGLGEAHDGRREQGDGDR
jgi:hypothetical protein